MIMKLIVASAVALALVPPAGAEASTYVDCGSNVGSGWTYGRTQGAGVFHVKAHNVSCRTARHITRASWSWSMWHSPNYNRMEMWRGDWYCWYRSTGIERGRTTCKAPYSQRVKWASGA